MKISTALLLTSPLLFLTAGVPAVAQTIGITFSGSGSSTNGSIVGSATGTFSPGGPVAISFTGASGRGECDNHVQITLKLQSANAGDTLTLLEDIPNGNSSNQSNFTLSGSLAVTAGTGVYAGLGGSGSLTISVQQSKPNFTITATGSLTLGGPIVAFPNIAPTGVVPVFSDSPSIQPGSWISIFGTAMANATTVWNGDFPTSLGGVTVSIDSKLAYIWFVSAGQINVQVPDDTKTGCVPVVVNTPNGTLTSSVDLEKISPSFSLLDNKYVAAVILTPNGTGAYGGGSYDLAGPVGRFSYPTRPVKRGENVVLYGVGFGPTLSAVPAGQVFSGAVKTANPVQVSLSPSSGNGIQPTVMFAGIVGAGLYQINFSVPQNAPTGDLIVQAIVGATMNNQGVATSSLNVFLPVQ